LKSSCYKNDNLPFLAGKLSLLEWVRPPDRVSWKAGFFVLGEPVIGQGTGSSASKFLN
jgi:hypothetical protein